MVNCKRLGGDQQLYQDCAEHLTLTRLAGNSMILPVQGTSR